MSGEKLSDEEIADHLAAMPGWALDDDGAIAKTFVFGDFVQAIQFVNRVAEAAEDAQHHPDLDIRFDKVTVSLSTHDAGGITHADFALAAKAESAASTARAVA